MRKISAISTNKTKQTLRTFYNRKNGVEIKSISEIARRMGLTSDLAYEELKKQYNEQIDTIRKAEARRKYREKKEGAIPFDKLEDAVLQWLAKTKAKNFNLELQARNGYKHTFTFNSGYHFENWFRAVGNEDVVGSDAVRIVTDRRNLFSVVKYNLKERSGGCVSRETDYTIKTLYYEFHIVNPKSKNNNCFFTCYKRLSGLDFRESNVRKEFGWMPNTKITIEQAEKVMEKFGVYYKIIEEGVDELLTDDKYIMLRGDHYIIVDGYTALNRNEIVTKRGSMFFDFETRETNKWWQTKVAIAENRNERLYEVKDTLCCAVYTPFMKEQQQLILVSREKSSARQLLDFLISEAKNGKTYNVYAHNGSRFDFYFLLSAMTPLELERCELNMRGTACIRIKFNGHIFKDTCCFLTDSLSNLSKAFQVEHGKITKMELHGKIISSAELCFYKPELKYDAFMKLEQEDSEFWNAYIKYCIYDCLALSEIWKKYSLSIDELLRKIFPRMAGIAPLTSAMTIGSHAKRIVDSLNSNGRTPNSYKRKIEQFAGVSVEKVDGKWVTSCDMEKYKFLCQFKRGGISHCNKAGMHENGITGIDIASQYPASMMNSMLPCGKSEWVKEYNDAYHGFYLLKNVKFAVSGFKPVALSLEGVSLNWSADTMNSLYVDSYLLKYLIKHYGITFEVENGLVSIEELASSKLFGKFINVFYAEKRLQDEYKETGNPLYNEAYRSTCKLYLNSVSGKLVEDPATHYSMSFCSNSKLELNGVGVEKSFNTEKYNNWIVAGLMVYSYSKRLLFEYIHCLPQKNNSVIHIETDGIYFDTRDKEHFEKNLLDYKGEFECVKFGSELGNVKLEKSTSVGTTSYFLGKKLYAIGTESGKNIYRCKGMPVSAIGEDQKPIDLINMDFYKGLYEGTPQTRKWLALNKQFFGETKISSFIMQRTINPTTTTYAKYE